MIKPLISLCTFTLLLSSFISSVKHPIIHSEPLFKRSSKLVELNDYTKQSSLESFNKKEPQLLLIESNQSGLFYVNDQNGFIIEYPFFKNTNFNKLILNRINNYNFIVESNPEIPVYIYQITNARDTNWFNTMNYLQGAAPEYNQLLISMLNPTIQFQSLNYRN